MSFLTQGQWNRPALTISPPREAARRALGFDPVELVRRAVISGKLPPVPVAPTRVPLSAEEARRRKLAAQADCMRALRAQRQAAGLTATGKPLQVKFHPELTGLPRKEYRRRWMQQHRQAARTAALSTLNLQPSSAQ